MTRSTTSGNPPINEQYALQHASEEEGIERDSVKNAYKNLVRALPDEMNIPLSQSAAQDSVDAAYCKMQVRTDALNFDDSAMSSTEQT